VEARAAFGIREVRAAERFAPVPCLRFFMKMNA
jgi:hypothetical protein